MSNRGMLLVFKHNCDEMWLLVWSGSVVGAVIGTSLNLFLYRCIYLPFIYDGQRSSMWYFLTVQAVTNYWNWPIGRLACMVNGALLALAVSIYCVFRIKDIDKRI